MPDYNTEIVINTEVARVSATGRVQKLPIGQGYVVTITKDKPMTELQRGAYFVYCGWVAKALNDAGFDIKKFYDAAKEGFEIPWTQEMVREALWKKVQFAMFQTTSSKQLTSDQTSQVYETLQRHLCETTEIEWIDWPHR